MINMIVWQEAYNLGIPEIDRQHQQLVKLLNDLLMAMRDGQTQAVIDSIISGLLQYASMHFDTEEAYLERYDYPETDKHKQEHQGFTARIHELNTRLQQKKSGVALEAMEFMTDWLNQHIRGSDKLFLFYLKRNEITVT